MSPSDRSSSNNDPTTTAASTQIASGSATTWRRRLEKRGINSALLFVAPALLLYASFFAYPLILTVRLSFVKWDAISPPNFVGLENYVRLFLGQTHFFTALKNNLLWISLTVPLQILIGLPLALLLDRKLRGRQFFRTIFFSPIVLSGAVIGATFSFMLLPGVGIVNLMFAALGLDGLDRAWLADPKWALYAAIAVNVWRSFGFAMVLYLAGLQSINPEIIESATVDGTSTLQQSWYITIPLLRPTTATLILLGVIGGMREFELIWLLTQGGPARLTEVLGIMVYEESFKFGNFGLSSAIAVLMVIITLAITFGQLYLYFRGTKE
jgi:raffinose/stachyose/melibiose transport system permease protein